MISNSDFNLLVQFFELDDFTSINFKYNERNIKVLFSKKGKDLNKFIAISFYYEYDLNKNICSYYISRNIIETIIKSYDKEKKCMYINKERLDNLIDNLFKKGKGKGDVSSGFLSIDTLDDFEMLKSFFYNQQINELPKIKTMFVNI